MTKPNTIWLSVTDICNNQCKWCYELGNNSAKIKYMDFEQLVLIVDSMEKIGVKKCILIGGEPTLHPNFLEIVSYIHSKRIKISLVTNGLQFSQKNIENFKNAPIDNLVISVHGWTNEKYSELTGNKTGFKHLIQSFKLLRDNKIKFGINIVISKFTKNYVNEIIDFLIAFGFNYVSFNIAAPIVSNNSINGIAVDEMGNYKTQILTLNRKCNEKKIKTSFLLIIPHCIFSNDEWQELSTTSSIISGCQVLHGRGLVFKTNGGMATCTHLSDFEIANNEVTNELIKSSESFLSFWNSSEISKIRKSANRYRFSQCKECSHWNECGGGCMIHWAYHKPEEIEISNIF